MKILLLSDIHQDYFSAENAGLVENPDLVLDCGDHHELMTLFELTPHYFVHGNHEPFNITLNEEGFPLPYKIDSNVIYTFKKGKISLNFAGIGGNYSSRLEDKSVNDSDVIKLNRFAPGSINVLLLHESPLNVSHSQGGYNLAQKVIKEIKRIKPEYVFSGHSGRFSKRDLGPIKFINLDDIAQGYGRLESTQESSFHFSRVLSKYR